MFILLTGVGPFLGNESVCAGEPLPSGLFADYAILVNLMEKDPLYQVLREEEQLQVKLYNQREEEGAPQPNFSRYNDLIYKVKNKYENALKALEYKFARAFPNQVRLMRKPPGEDKPNIKWKYDSPFLRIFEYQVLYGKTAEHIRGHRITNYHPFVEIAHSFLDTYHVVDIPIHFLIRCSRLMNGQEIPSAK